MNEKNRKTHLFLARVYYEDTDHSGVVYHANYLKFFERAREDIIGISALSDMWHQKGIGFAVYKATLGFHDGAVFGDLLDIKTTWEKEGAYRIIFFHEAWRPDATKPAVTCTLELVCLGPNKKLMPIPDLDFLMEKDT
ncbi:MAG: YbgC/FadM family acyl-CoA thioesterase [Proteobacteria bacterium]|nr:YbgC/FadM family acyl-CoA thioesterase [Pseudomonadota bacterium]MBU1584400.1 YbgC/FadM family acyl-CoA thioesterase [Pseudomonadota bacterium]MBU2454739.1 YbgC/FadM family acyl-CoA thioesterase [Pseudomonadota bacterium]MBU2628265.1 YbgC/FadM family acyl-CoA thioesterase [Pseudomonadota bacterium]